MEAPKKSPQEIRKIRKRNPFKLPKIPPPFPKISPGKKKQKICIFSPTYLFYNNFFFKKSEKKILLLGPLGVVFFNKPHWAWGKKGPPLKPPKLHFFFFFPPAPPSGFIFKNTGPGIKNTFKHIFQKTSPGGKSPLSGIKKQPLNSMGPRKKKTVRGGPTPLFLSN